MVIILEDKFKIISFYLCLSIVLILSSFCIYNLITRMYFWALFYFIIVVLNIIVFYLFTKTTLHISINIFFVFYTFLAYINVVFCYEIFPSAYFYFIPLIIGFKSNYDPRLFYSYLLFLIVILFSVPFSYGFMKQIIQYEWYFLPSKDDLIFNYVLDFVFASSIAMIIFSFSKELKKEKLEQKYFYNIVNKSTRDQKLKKLQFICDLVENPEYENKLEKLFFVIKKVIEKEMVYQDYKYDILMLSKRLNIGKKDIINALNYHEARLDFDEILDFYRYKKVKKAFDESLHTKISIKEIYKAAGFKYKSKFIAVFTYFEGMSPEEFMIKNYSAMV